MDRFSKNTQISNFMKVYTLEAELFRADGRMNGQTTDMAKIIVAFRNFANAAKLANGALNMQDR
jgi:hypothetical protein